MTADTQVAAREFSTEELASPPIDPAGRDKPPSSSASASTSRWLRKGLGLVALVVMAGGAGGIVGADRGLDVAAVLDAVEGAVADIQTTGLRQAGQGTGIVYSADGLVLTNAAINSGNSGGPLVNAAGTTGATIAEVTAGSPAAQAGLEAGRRRRGRGR